MDVSMDDGEYDLRLHIPEDFQPPCSLGKFRYQDGKKDGGPLKTKQGRSGFGFQLNVGIEHVNKRVTAQCVAVTNEDIPKHHPFIIKSEGESDGERSTYGIVEKVFTIEDTISEHRFEGVRLVVPKRENRSYQHIIDGRKSYIEYDQIPNMEPHSGNSLGDVDLSSFRIAVLIKLHEPSEVIDRASKVSRVAVTFTDPIFNAEKKPKLEIKKYVPKKLLASGDDAMIILCSELTQYLAAGSVDVLFFDDSEWSALGRVSYAHTKSVALRVTPPAYKLQQFPGLRKVCMKLVSGNSESAVMEVYYYEKKRHTIRPQRIRTFRYPLSTGSREVTSPEAVMGPDVVRSPEVVTDPELVTGSGEVMDSRQGFTVADSPSTGTADNARAADTAGNTHVAPTLENIFPAIATVSNEVNYNHHAMAMDETPSSQETDNDGTVLTCPLFVERDDAWNASAVGYDDLDDLQCPPGPTQTALSGDLDPLWMGGERRQLSTPTRNSEENPGDELVPLDQMLLSNGL